MGVASTLHDLELMARVVNIKHKADLTTVNAPLAVEDKYSTTNWVFFITSEWFMLNTYKYLLQAQILLESDATLVQLEPVLYQSYVHQLIAQRWEDWCKALLTTANMLASD